MVKFVSIAKFDELESGKGKIIKLNGKEIALFKVSDKIFAIDNECKHQGGPLGEGICNEGIVTCPWHQWRYDLKTGLCPENPQIKVKTYEVSVDGNDINIDI
jgi:nitrite reductase (NADH) small subunit